ncbi:MAG: hypothetical protein J5817_01830 [Treponema sp.]|nr:hypothetical protein [Treponema sp.]
MAIGFLFIALATLVGFAFWIFVAILLYKLVKKQPVKKTLITAGILAFIWLLIVITGIGTFFSVKKVSVANAIPYMSYESAKKNWSTKMLKKTSDFELSIDKIQQIPNEKEWISFEADVKTDSEDSKPSKTDELLGKDDYVTYEMTLVVNNKSDNAGISYKKLRKANLVYVQDENEVFIPAYIINHAEFDDVPWILSLFMPQYKKDQKQEFVPLGKSYLNVRVEIPNGHTISKFVFGNTVLDVNMKDFVK